ncbi:hypothetical protein [Methylocapsa acidiphila]|uniref:hypothetical protein n=1 Tax=Methylocapsa acidiphila TaxID=133552 RepID=UPI0003F8612F|nr:hypothetical protein [Methylocapsa acidiphila]
MRAKLRHIARLLLDALRGPRVARPETSDPFELDAFYNRRYAPRRIVRASSPPPYPRDPA